MDTRRRRNCDFTRIRYRYWSMSSKKFDIPEWTIAVSSALKTEEQTRVEKTQLLLESEEDPRLIGMFVHSRIRDTVSWVLSTDSDANLESVVDRAREEISSAFSITPDQLRHDFHAFLQMREENKRASTGDRFAVAMEEEQRSERSCEIFVVLRPDIAEWKYRLKSAFLAKGQFPPAGERVHDFVFQQYEIAKAECEESGGSEESPEEAGLRIGRELDALFSMDPDELVAIFEAGKEPPSDMQFA